MVLQEGGEDRMVDSLGLRRLRRGIRGEEDEESK
jgi:hypothetical protein